MTTTQLRDSQQTTPYLVVAADSHAGPSLRDDLGPYCPEKYRSAFDEHLHDVDRLHEDDLDFASLTRDQQYLRRLAIALATEDDSTERNESREQARLQTNTAKGQNDSHGRLRDMDDDGVAADVIFAGGGNGEMLPFMGLGSGAGPANIAPELRSVGIRMWNRWLADFVSIEPERHVGMMQIPIWDVDLAVKEVTFAVDAGLKGVNLPAPRADYPGYNDPVYEPFWSACEEMGVAFATHTGGGEPALGISGLGGVGCSLSESHWLSRRGLWQLIFGGVFERHPGLRLVFTETRIEWGSPTLRELDSIYFNELYDDQRSQLKKLPSEYWASNCFLSGSFLAPFEVEIRDEVGLGNLMWGTDYPHMEGTWPHTKLALRNTFSGVPYDEARMILGGNALRVYNLDEKALRKVADRIGPTPLELDDPLSPEEFPSFRGHAFRTRSSWS